MNLVSKYIQDGLKDKPKKEFDSSKTKKSLRTPRQQPILINY